MHFIVCIKQVPETTDVKINPETNTLIREGVVSIVNPFDMYAIEEAVRLKEKLGDGAVKGAERVDGSWLSTSLAANTRRLDAPLLTASRMIIFDFQGGCLRSWIRFLCTATMKSQAENTGT